MPAFTKLKRASFMGIEFPVSEVEVRGGIRDHIHEYPHADGGAPEKLGRKLYEIKMVGNFQATFVKYPKLWPDGLKNLRQTFEKQLTGDLVIPTIGTIKAYARTWTQTMTPKSSLSGEIASFDFAEDQTDTSLVKEDLAVNIQVLPIMIGAVNAQRALAEFGAARDISLFDALSNAVNSVLAVADIADAAAGLISAKILAVTDLCSQISNTLTAKDARNAPLISALHDLWDTSQRANENLFQEKARQLTYVVPSTMSVSAISSVLYDGDASRGIEIMQLNPIEDPFAVRAGTKINYLEPTTQLPGGLVNLPSGFAR